MCDDHSDETSCVKCCPIARSVLASFNARTVPEPGSLMDREGIAFNRESYFNGR